MATLQFTWQDGDVVWQDGDVLWQDYLFVVVSEFYIVAALIIDVRRAAMNIDDRQISAVIDDRAISLI